MGKRQRCTRALLVRLSLRIELWQIRQSSSTCNPTSIYFPPIYYYFYLFAHRVQLELSYSTHRNSNINWQIATNCTSHSMYCKLQHEMIILQNRTRECNGGRLFSAIELAIMNDLLSPGTTRTLHEYVLFSR